MASQVHGRIDRSENEQQMCRRCQRVHGRIDRSESCRHTPRYQCFVHGRIDRSEKPRLPHRQSTLVHGRIDRSEIPSKPHHSANQVHGRIGCSKISFSQQPYRKRLAERGLRLGARQVHGKMCRLLQWLYTWLHFLINVMPSCYKLQAQRLGGICFPSAVYSFAAGRKAGVACHRRYCTW